MTVTTTDNVDLVAQALRGARQVVVVTGAGMSAGSGIATYRESGGGGWDDPDLEHLMHAARFRQHLPRLWAHFDGLREQVAEAEPNAAHRALVDWERLLSDRGGRLTVVTQNVDGLHARAGSGRVLALHGDVTAARCVDDCGTDVGLGARDGEGVPRCPCGAPQRPDVVLFGERLDPLLRHEAKSATRWCDAVVYVGTSGTVEPVASLHEFAPPDHPRVLLNRDPWERRGRDGRGVFSHVALGRAEELLPALVGRIGG